VHDDCYCKIESNRSTRHTAFLVVGNGKTFDYFFVVFDSRGTQWCIITKKKAKSFNISKKPCVSGAKI